MAGDHAYSFPAIFAVGFPAIECLDAIRIQKHSGGIFKPI